jgi:hypothetical protein
MSTDTKAPSDTKPSTAAPAEAAKLGPTISSVSPAKACAGSIITLSGTNFGEAKDDGFDADYDSTKQDEVDAVKKLSAAPVKRRNDAKITVNGRVARHVSLWTPSLIKLHVPAVPAGEGEIVVELPEGRASRAFEAVL